MVDDEGGEAVWHQEVPSGVEGVALLEVQAWSWCLRPPFRPSLVSRLQS